MHCPACQKELVEIPSHEGPQLDVCPDRHGVWLDVGEVKLVVHHDAVIPTPAETKTPDPVRLKNTSCPRCGGHLFPAPLGEASILTCRSCQGLWFTEGSLTHLNEPSMIGGTGSSSLQEARYYVRAAAKRPAPSPRVGRPRMDARLRRRRQAVWFWTLFLSGVCVIAGLILFAGLRKIGAAGLWVGTPDHTWWYLTFGLAAGIGLVLYGLLVNGRRRLIEGTPRSSIRSLAVGLVEVGGRAEPENEPLRAPFSGIPCVLFSYRVEERRGSGKRARWRTIAQGMSGEPFFVRDETGRIMVIPFEAELVLPRNRTTRHSWLGSLPEQAVIGLTDLGISPGGWWGEKAMRCSETYILPEETVYVLGTAHQRHRDDRSNDNSARLYIGSSRDHPFIISDRSEKDLLSRLTWQVVGLFVGGSVLTVTCLFFVMKTYWAVVR